MIKKISIVLLLLIVIFFVYKYVEKKQTKSYSPQETVTYTERGLILEVNYSRPYTKGRAIFGGLVPYNQVWRTGANEATTFETKNDILIGGKRLNAGIYGLFTIPRSDRWTIIFNNIDDQWGAFDYDETKDVLRVDAYPEQLYDGKFQEQLLIDFDASGMNITWDLTRVHVDINNG